MSEIKFRVWDKKTQTMRAVCNISFFNKTVGIEPLPSDEAYEFMKGCLTLSRSFADVIIMQFTGLFDKRGKEIWEGDILETDDYKDIPRSLEHEVGALPVKVILENGSFRVRYTNEKSNIPQRKPYQTLENYLDQPFLRSGLVIIGNIHDNPELLESEEKK